MSPAGPRRHEGSGDGTNVLQTWSPTPPRLFTGTSVGAKIHLKHVHASRELGGGARPCGALRRFQAMVSAGKRQLGDR
jgi:hypothetical protein